MQECGNIGHLRIDQVEFRHPFVGPADLQEFAELFAVLVVQDKHRTDQVRPALAACCAAAVAKPAGRNVLFLAALDGGRIELRASSPEAAGRRLLSSVETERTPQQHHRNRANMIRERHPSSKILGVFVSLVKIAPPRDRRGGTCARPCDKTDATISTVSAQGRPRVAPLQCFFMRSGAPPGGHEELL